MTAVAALVGTLRQKAMSIINRIGPDPNQTNVSWERQAVALQIEADADALEAAIASDAERRCGNCVYRDTSEASKSDGKPPFAWGNNLRCIVRDGLWGPDESCSRFAPSPVDGKGEGR